MFNSMRSGKNKTAMYVVMGLLMFGLTGFGIGGIGGGAVQSIGTVGEEPISVNTYARAYSSAVSQMNQRFGRALSPSEIQQLGLSQNVLDAVVGVAAVDNEATQKGISVGDDIVRQNILQNPRFQGLDGTFDQEAYDFFLDRQLNVTAAEFDELLRKENARAIVEGAVSAGISSSDAMPLALVGYVQEARSFEWAWVTNLQLSEPVGTPTDTDLQSFYDDNKDNYRSLRTHDVTYAWLTPDMLLSKVDVPEEQMQESYDLQSDRFNKPEQRIVDRIVFPTTEEAEAARDRLDALSATFETLASDRGLEAGDIDLGEVEFNDLSIEAAEVVFNTDGPGVIGPVESSLGPALFRINAIIAEDITPFEDAREEIRAELAGESARRLVSDLLTEIDDLLAAGATLEELGADTDMQTAQIDFNADSVGGIAGYDAFQEAVLAAQQGDFPELTDLSDGGIFALRVNSVNEPAQIPFEDVKEQVRADWTQAETLKALRAVAEDYKSKLESGQAFADLELAPNVQTDARRDSFFEGLPPEALIEVFKTETGKVVVLDGENGVFLARLTGVTEFDAAGEANSGLIEQLTASLNTQIAADLLDMYTVALRDQAGVELNQAALNSVNSQIAAQ